MANATAGGYVGLADTPGAAQAVSVSRLRSGGEYARQYDKKAKFTAPCAGLRLRHRQSSTQAAVGTCLGCDLPNAAHKATIEGFLKSRYRAKSRCLQIESCESMYAVKVNYTDQADNTQPGEGSASSLQSSREAGCETETIQVSAGNPRVEHITGLIHLYRELGDRSRAVGGAPSSLLVSDHRGTAILVHES